ncbi:AarF/ABC1/UbiB kinase family protein [Mumia sp. zg.B21]|uniref:ABC1 kinase family protein n=1 Tax=Mumia sp. zg.B21 TaxID=2855447 RepID=UPI001C6E7FBC|nr:AarF/ABC1/UbiB kinase family protein [Mumia sp. zg.B21]MBW9210994.1 AarF/ABC1/UbiB kinase family protein [Mumia sp. zg.B21]
MTDGPDTPDDDGRGSAVPHGSFSRAVKLASLPIGFAGRTTVGMGRRLVGAPANAVLTEVQLRTAEQIFAVLGELKGGAMKFGQAMSVYEAAVPPELMEPYREAFVRLQDDAPPMPVKTVHRIFAGELGPRWREQLVELDDTPAAAASIGQVHRGRWFDGREVAVKVQYPGAAAAMRSDLRQIGRLSRLFAVAFPSIDVKPLAEELAERVREELDYGLEAEAQRAFAAAFADDPQIVVPDVVAHTETILVTTWMESKASLAQIISDGLPSERDHYGELFARFLFAGPRRVGMLHADPHPGNYRILDDGRLGVVDYGAVARVPGGLPPVIGRLLRAAVDDDYATVVDGLREEGFIKPGVRIDEEIIRSYLEPFVEPARHEVFTFSREWMREQAQRVSRPAREGLGTAMKINLPPSYLLIHRVWSGGLAILSQLDATAPFRGILEESLPGFAD